MWPENITPYPSPAPIEPPLIKNYTVHWPHHHTMSATRRNIPICPAVDSTRPNPEREIPDSQEDLLSPTTSTPGRGRENKYNSYSRICTPYPKEFERSSLSLEGSSHPSPVYISDDSHSERSQYDWEPSSAVDDLGPGGRALPTSPCAVTDSTRLAALCRNARGTVRRAIRKTKTIKAEVRPVGIHTCPKAHTHRIAGGYRRSSRSNGRCGKFYGGSSGRREHYES